MRTVLVVDDEPVVLRTASQMLEMAGYNVLPASDVESAISQASKPEARIDLVLVNHSVDRVSGYDLVGELLKLHPGLKILRFSGNSEQNLRASGELRPESFFIAKPFTPKQLREKVSSIIGPA